MSERLVTQREYEDLVRKFQALERRLGRVEVLERSAYTFGTYTPTYVGGTTAGVTTYTAQVGAWRLRGDEISVFGQVAWSAATGTGEARISLPNAPAGYNAVGTLWINNVTFANSTPLLTATAGNTYFVLDSPLTNAGNTRVNVEAAGNIIWSLTYLV